MTGTLINIKEYYLRKWAVVVTVSGLLVLKPLKQVCRRSIVRFADTV